LLHHRNEMCFPSTRNDCWSKHHWLINKIYIANLMFHEYIPSIVCELSRIWSATIEHWTTSRWPHWSHRIFSCCKQPEIRPPIRGFFTWTSGGTNVRLHG
jgi:hypothetical protein